MSENKLEKAFNAVSSKLLEEGLPLPVAIPLAVILPPPFDVFALIGSISRYKRKNQ